MNNTDLKYKGGALITTLVPIDADNAELDKSYREITDAMKKGQIVLADLANNYHVMAVGYGYYEGKYYLYTADGGDGFTCEKMDDHPGYHGLS